MSQLFSTLPEDCIMVYPIDSKKLIAYINELAPPEENKEYTVNGGAIEPRTNWVTDDECCYFDTPNRLVEGKVQESWLCPVWVKTWVSKNGETTQCSTTAFPEFEVTISIEKLKTMCKPQVTLKEFMGSRYNYNPRIISNMRNFLGKLREQLEPVKTEA